MLNVMDILRHKGVGYIGVSPDTVTIDALRLMADKNLGAVLVVDNGKIVGMFSERDYARKIVLKGKSSANTSVSEFMTSPVITVSQQTSLSSCMEIMTDKHFRHLPVVENGNIVGVVSIGDIVNRIIHSQSETIRQLEEYITRG